MQCMGLHAKSVRLGNEPNAAVTNRVCIGPALRERANPTGPPIAHGCRRSLSRCNAQNFLRRGDTVHYQPQAILAQRRHPLADHGLP